MPGTKWMEGSSSMKSHESTILYSCGEEHENDVDFGIKKKLYQILSSSKQQMTKYAIRIYVQMV